MATLIVRLKDRELSRVQLSKTVTTIGRDRECDVQIDNVSVSRLHAKLRYVSKRGFVLEDAGSRNGLSVNGQMVPRETIMGWGDVINIGKFSIELSSIGGVPEDRLVPVAETGLRLSPENVQETFAVKMDRLKGAASDAGPGVPLPLPDLPRHSNLPRYLFMALAAVLAIGLGFFVVSLLL